MDKDSGGNIIVGGTSLDTGMTKTYNAPDPFMLYIQLGNIYLWGICFGIVNFDKVSIVKFNTDGTKIFAGFEQVTSSIPLTFSIFSSSNGSLIKTYKVNSGVPSL